MWLLLVSGEVCGNVVGVRRYRSLQKNANVRALEQRAARGAGQCTGGAVVPALPLIYI